MLRQKKPSSKTKASGGSGPESSKRGARRTSQKNPGDDATARYQALADSEEGEEEKPRKFKSRSGRTKRQEEGVGGRRHMR